MPGSVRGFDPNRTGTQTVTVSYHDQNSGNDFAASAEVTVVTDNGAVLCENGHWHPASDATCPYCNGDAYGGASFGIVMLYTTDILAEFDRQHAAGIADPVILLSEGDTFSVEVGFSDSGTLARLASVFNNISLISDRYRTGFIYGRSEIA